MTDMPEKIIISIPAFSPNKDTLSNIDDSFIVVERKPTGPQASVLTELLHHCFIQISNVMLSTVGEQIFLLALLPVIKRQLEKPKIINSQGVIVESEITKYLDRIALLVICPVYNEKIKQELNTKFYFLIDPDWSDEELQYAILRFKAEMQKFMDKQNSEIYTILEKALVYTTIVLSFDAQNNELLYLGPKLPTK